METIIKNLKHTFIIVGSLALLVGILHQPAGAQDNKEIPEREYVSPEELVSLSKNTRFSEAIDLLNEYSQRYAGKVIVDRTNTTGEIGVPISDIHWREALLFIADVQGLEVVDSNRFFEIVEYEGTQHTASRDRDSGQVTDEDFPTFGSREIRIRAVFFEGNKRALREIGVDWSTIHNISTRPEGLSQVIDPMSGGGGGGTGGGRQTLPDLRFDNDYVEVNSRAAQEVTENLFNGVINFGEIANGIEVRALFKAFEANNLGKILATPEIKVRDGQEGRIQVGQDFSIKQRDFAGNVIDQFFSVGTILKVTPNMVNEGDSTFIDMVISAERSSAQPSTVSTIINKQQADSEILLLDGESTVIAGLFRTEDVKVRKGVPLLKDLPGWFFGLRYMFGYNSDEQIEQELVILIKATIEPTLAERREGRLKSSQENIIEQRSQYRETGEAYREIIKDETLNDIKKKEKEEGN